MAFNKAIKTPFGVPAVYWNIIRKTESYEPKGISVTMLGYASEEVRRTGGTPLAQVEETFTGDDYVKEASREDIYKALKQRANWSEAEDA